MRICMQRMIFSRTSPAQMIQHSIELRAKLKHISTRRRLGRRTFASLRAAKHRFESVQKPLGRSILNFDIILELMIELATTRTHMQGRRSKAWITWVMGTPRHILVCAMLADAAD